MKMEETKKDEIENKEEIQSKELSCNDQLDLSTPPEDEKPEDNRTLQILSDINSLC